MRKAEISAEEYEQIVTAEKATQDKRTSRKLQVLMLRYKGCDNKTIAERVGLCAMQVSRIANEYKRVGLAEFTRKKYGGNHRNMTVAEENEILAPFKTKAEAGQIITAMEIKKAFDEKLGRDTGRGYIYILLARHHWRKVMPRPKHPQKADDETILASKKLTAL